MTTKIIAENILDKDDFLSATSQEGERIGLPVADDANTGRLRPLTQGTLKNESVSTVATAAGTQTTMISDFLEGYGDGFFIGWTLTCNGGANDGDTATITAFTQSTGTLAWTGDVTANTAAGDMFTLTRDWENFDGHVELVTSGDAGSAAFKWSFDGGANYLGRDSLWQDTWIDVRQIVGSSKSGLSWIVPIAIDSDTVLLAYQDDALSDYAYCKKSTDRGMTYGALTAITSAAATVICGICLKHGPNAGRVIVSVLDATDGKLYYSDDEGDTWSLLHQVGNSAYSYHSIIELSNGNLAAVRYVTGATYYLQYAVSSDGGKTWSSVVNIRSTDAAYIGCDLIECANGDLLVVYSNDEGTAGQYEISAYISSNAGTSWSAVTDAQAGVAGEDYQSPRLLMDVDGTIYCAYVCVAGGNVDKVFLQKTVDNGTTWDTRKTILTDATRDPKYCAWCYLGPDVLLIAKGEAGGAGDILGGTGDMEDTTDFDTDVGSPTTNERSNTVAHGGTYSHKIVCDSDGDGTSSAALTSIAGATYNVSGWFYLSGTDWVHYGTYFRWSPKLIMKVLDGDGTLRHTETWTIYTPGVSANTWVYFAVAVTTPTGGAASKIQFVVDEIDETGGPASVTFYLDDLQMLEVGSTGTSLRRGQWETYSANGATVPINAMPSSLINGVELVWHGAAGILGDIWTIDPEYSYGMANIIECSPGKPWRSTADNEACSITIDMGATGMIYADGVAFFGCNLRTLSFQMHATDAWGAPSVNESISFDFVTGGVLDSNSAANEIHDAALLANYKDHELKGKYLRFTAGTLDTYTFKIIDNIGDYILVDGDTDDAALGDTFIIYQTSVAKTFTGGPYRYARIYIAAQQTAEDYYQIGMMVAGKAITLTTGIRIGADRNSQYTIDYLRSRGGNITPIKRGERKRIWQITQRGTERNMDEMLSTLDYLDGKNVCLIPDSTDLLDIYLCKATAESVNRRHLESDVYDLGPITLEEIL